LHPAAGSDCVYGGNQRDNQAISGRERPPYRGRGKDAQRMVEVRSVANRIVDTGVYNGTRARRMVSKAWRKEATMTVQEPIHQVDAERGNLQIERIYRDWDAALRDNNVAALLSLYAVYAELQSPLVCHLMNK